jgi:serine/threonine-protein kinase
VQGGQIVTLCDAHLFDGGSWGESGTIVAALDLFLSRVSSTGNGSAQLTELAPGEIAHRWPQVLPGGTAALFSSHASATGLDGANIDVVSLSDGRRKTLVRGGTWGRYLPGGYLVYLNNGTLFSVRFDPNLLEVRGTPMPVLDNIAYSAAWGSAQIDFSRVGTLVYRSATVGAGLVTVQLLDPSGNTRPLITVPGNYLSPTLSPDGTRLAFTSAGDIWVYELGRGSMMRLTVGGGHGNPVWTGDGRYVMFRAARGMFWTRADGTGQQQPLTQSNRQQIPWSFTTSGKRLSFVEVNPANRAEIWTMSVNSDGSGLRAGKPEAFLQETFNVRSPMFSPDGRWIAYQSDESGGSRVYVQAFPDKHGKRQISPSEGELPSWSRNGRELFFFQFGQPGQLMVASYQSRGDSFLADKPRVWSEGLAGFTTTRSYDPAPDGKHVLALTPAETHPKGSQDQMIILLNFFDELRRLVPSNPN